jgi:hypothetical protein
MLSDLQRDKIRDALSDIADDLDLNFLEERQIIENLDAFPLVQVTFQTEGRRQRYWNAMLHEFQNLTTKAWETYYGHIAQATVSVSIRSTDVDELHTAAVAFDLDLWKKACNWTLEQAGKIEFRGNDPPRFLPAYKAYDDLTNIYSCVLNFMVDYEFSWTVADPPITNFVIDTEAGIGSDTKSISGLYAIAPGCYLIDCILED